MKKPGLVRNILSHNGKVYLPEPSHYYSIVPCTNPYPLLFWKIVRAKGRPDAVNKEIDLLIPVKLERTLHLVFYPLPINI